eukprot:9970440-Alexandrium_andersonii.AAC.1
MGNSPGPSTAPLAMPASSASPQLTAMAFQVADQHLKHEARAPLRRRCRESRTGPRGAHRSRRRRRRGARPLCPARER